MDHPGNLCGRQLNLPLLREIGLVRSNSASRVSWHAHPGFEILFLLEGRTAYEFKSGQIVELQGGHFLVVPPNAVHRGRHDVRAPCRICGLALSPLRPNVAQNSPFTPADVARIRSSLTRSAVSTHPLNPALRWIIKQLLQETQAFGTAPDNDTSAVVLRTLVSAAILEAVRQIISPPQAPKAIIAAAVAYLGGHYHEPLSIGRLAAHLGYSRSRVFELFKSEMGLSPNDYLQRIRIEKAQQLLRETRKSVTAIALETGFSSGQYFSTVFRHYAGESPAGYRKKTAGKV